MTLPGTPAVQYDEDMDQSPVTSYQKLHPWMFQSLSVINLFVSTQSAPVRVRSSPIEVNEMDTPAVRN